MTVTTELVIFIITCFGAIAGILTFGWKWIDSRMKESDDKTDESFDKIYQKLDEVKTDIHKFQLDTVRNYATRADLDRVRVDIKEQHDALRKDLERLRAGIVSPP